MVMWIWRQYQDGMPPHTFVPYWGVLRDVLHKTSMDDGDPQDVDMELEGNGALNIYDDALAIAYLQVGEVLIRLTPKERDYVMHRAKRFKWESNSLLRMWGRWTSGGCASLRTT
jgi:hypothetical protein